MKNRESNGPPDDLEPWPFYYRFRKAEVNLVYKIIPDLPAGSWLDIGCGIGYMTGLLSEKAGSVVGLDLPFSNSATHSPGLDRAFELNDRTGRKNVGFAGCSAEELPISSSSADLVFSAYTLEHIPDKKKALEEIARVLRPGGEFILLVPGAAERLAYLPAYYIELLFEVFRWIRIRLRKRIDSVETARDNSELGSANAPGEKSGILNRFRMRHPNFPFPPPHGEYGTSFGEFKAHLPWRWERLMEDAGLKVESRFASFIIPTQLIDIFSPWLRTRLFEAGSAILPVRIRKSLPAVLAANGIILAGKKYRT